ncbi:hypothetical protein [Cytobacillus purgationiresistens]|uniref:Uncharacterized protein n=1 Tax=Cytobacillus purgationiresistens TaxID=863449 RepID=A0ABU0AIX4_9BACI|nr:hypothetical protein [Cytobacillus purgationiresistens]MDQ0271210.1 hypothetical protein [Cytobacillus purgationiresistens]
MSAIIRHHLVNNGFDVLDREVHHRNFLQELIEYEKPSIMILHDSFLESELENSKDKEKEILRLIEHWRIQFEDGLRVVYVCERERSDPHLGALVARNVLDIFHQQRIPIDIFIKQLLEPPKYSNVAKIKITDLDITDIDFQEDSEFPPKADKVKIYEDEVETAKNEKKDSSSEEIVEDTISKEVEVTEPLKRKKTTKTKKEKPLSNPQQNFIPNVLSLLQDEKFLSKFPVREKTIIQDRIVGSIFISIVGTERNVGSTHLSLLLANHLNEKKLKVAVLEANHSNDLFAIEYAYEGGRGYYSTSNTFSIRGIDHYKSIKYLDISELINKYDFIILDIGDAEHSNYFEEFYRSHVQIVTAHGSEWKKGKIQEFISKHPTINKDNVILATPFTDNLTSKELEKEFDMKAYSIPANSDPYTSSRELIKVLDQILASYIPADKKEKNTLSNKFIYLGGGIFLLLLMLMVMNLFK